MEPVNEFIECFKAVPAKLDRMQEILSTRQLTKEELAEMAIECTDLCFGEYKDALSPELENFGVDDMSSNYIADAVKMLIEAGLDSNITINDENALWNTIWIDAPGIGANVLRLMLESGGNPNHYLPGERETLFEYTAFSFFYDMDFHRFQCFIVLMAYGGCYKNGEIPITMLNGNAVDIFKNFEKYDCSTERIKIPGGRDNLLVHIFNTDTGEEVAKY
ncbi:MAG: hypothetical protein IJN39_03795 [Clostridia bacterium]|nr:hypothetical protein [Clostridia bacterium]